MVFGIFYRGEMEHEFIKEKIIHDIPITISGNIIYLDNSESQPLEKNINDIQHIISFLNKNSKITHSFTDIITFPNTKCIEKNEQDYGVRENEFSIHLEALSRGGQSWKSKFFIIRDNFLLYFKDDTSTKPEGVIPLEGSEIRLSKEYEYCLEILSGTRRYHIRTNNSDISTLLQKLEKASQLTIETMYDIKETLGNGSSAKVKRAVERSTGKEFAIKIISKDNIENRDNIMTEITILKNTSHPTIMNLHHVFETKRKIFLITELLQGGELFDLIVKKGNLTESETSKIMRRVVQGLSYLHMKNICHRDLKPENILLAKKEDLDSVRITDFGLSKIVGQHKKMKTACGTPSYVAPEILKGPTYDFEVDMWSCGVILYVLLCGFPPFYADNDPELYDLIKSGKYSFPSPYWDNISENAKDLINRLLVVEPSKRLTPIQFLLHPFITNYRSLSFNRGIRRELSSYLITQKKLKKGVGTQSKNTEKDFS